MDECSITLDFDILCCELVEHAIKLIIDPKIHYLTIWHPSRVISDKTIITAILHGLRLRAIQWNTDFIMSVNGISYNNGTLYLKHQALASLINDFDWSEPLLDGLTIRQLSIELPYVREEVDLSKMFGNQIPTVVIDMLYRSRSGSIRLPNETKTLYLRSDREEVDVSEFHRSFIVSTIITEINSTDTLLNLFPNAELKISSSLN